MYSIAFLLIFDNSCKTLDIPPVLLLKELLGFISRLLTLSDGADGAGGGGMKIFLFTFVDAGRLIKVLSLESN